MRYPNCIKNYKITIKSYGFERREWTILCKILAARPVKIDKIGITRLKTIRDYLNPGRYCRWISSKFDFWFFFSFVFFFLVRTSCNCLSFILRIVIRFSNVNPSNHNPYHCTTAYWMKYYFSKNLSTNYNS